ncbi:MULTISPECIES: YbfB/YjiJ family MFS transporter [Brevibacterium]|uniref:MFS transporter n=2 Tax=Brevibacterium TaxID=1696 RepID=A0A2H1KFD5_BREAU|nr:MULTISPECIES: YbfB/YjiJ family MFS transporter [Brevibacterium]AZL08211.1 MFS transporter [Brevibacterium aurantiacum]AZT96057.1 MFS transporter [Brevibacterium aurantiacum]MDN5773396.1 YbfB/YjiJ family MFS transporter [Brevibacterium aurantiacum]PCC56663.1 MFS transporter [Brevibacterium aurantiacum]RCS85071.1 YbfB/YjiJ family MFS transporter [Brevibacterium aurantiacum]
MPESIARPALTPVRGALGLSVAMGMGRFFYTPALPLMVAALYWSSAPGAWIATLNYVGYFIGTLVIAQGWVEPNRFVYRLSLIVSTVGLAAVALTPNLIWQGGIRTIAGIASGLIFVCVTQRIPANSRKPRDGGISYGGVGFGILVSGAIVLAAGSIADWRQLWLICAAVSAIFSVLAWTWPIPARIPQHTPAEAAEPTTTDESTDTPTPFEANRRRAMALLSTGYFFQGGGYIIIGTYLVVLAGPVFGATAAASTWLIAGIATAASPLTWSAVAARIGTVKALTLCYCLQVFGALLAVFGSTPFVLIIAAALFGFTFIGVVMMTIGIGTQMGVTNASAKLTSWYSIGQIVGPAIVAAALSEHIAVAFIASAIALAIAMALTLVGVVTGNVDR